MYMNVGTRLAHSVETKSSFKNLQVVGQSRNYSHFMENDDSLSSTICGSRSGVVGQGVPDVSKVNALFFGSINARRRAAQVCQNYISKKAKLKVKLSLFM